MLKMILIKVFNKIVEISNYLEKPYILIENRSPTSLVKKGMEEKFKEAFY